MALLHSGIQTQSLPPSAAEKILNEQRLKRPSSPHFTIYQPQLTWIGSIANRVTGAGLSACESPTGRAVSTLFSLSPIIRSALRVRSRLPGRPRDIRLCERD